MAVSRHRLNAWLPGRSLTRAVLVLSAVAALLIGCTWALNDSPGTAELRVTLPPQQETIGALQVTEDTELFVHIIEADRFEALYADAEDSDLVVPNGGLPDNAKRLRAEQLGISRAAYLNARDDTGVLQSSRFAWFFGQGARDGISLTFRDLKPDTEYILYAIQREPEEGTETDVLFGVGVDEEDDGPIRLERRQDQTVTLELEPFFLEPQYEQFFTVRGATPAEPPLPPSDPLLEADSFAYAAAFSRATITLTDEEGVDRVYQPEFSFGLIQRFEEEGETAYGLAYYESDDLPTEESPPESVLFIELIDVNEREPDNAVYRWEDIFEIVYLAGGFQTELDQEIVELSWGGGRLEAPEPEGFSAGFEGGGPSVGGTFSLEISGEVDGVIFDPVDETEIVIDRAALDLEFTFGELIEESEDIPPPD